MRFDKLMSFQNHTMHKKMFKKLSQQELGMLINFVKENENINVNEYTYKVNRWLLDQEKPKNHAVMWALALMAKDG